MLKINSGKSINEYTMTSSLCGESVRSRRGLLASLWSLVTLLTALAFVVAFIFTLSTQNDNDNYGYYYYDNEQEGKDNNNQDPEVAVTSRAMAFAALWTGVLATLMSIFGTVILGWQSPMGEYYTCCSPQVHRTTPLSLGSFIGALLMFANLTLVCSGLFGEFQIRDYQREGEDRGQAQENDNDSLFGRSSMAFSIMCIFLTVLYAGFAALTFAFSNSLLEELAADERAEALQMNSRSQATHFVGGYNGYIRERFDVRRQNGVTSGFVAPNSTEGSLT